MLRNQVKDNIKPTGFFYTSNGRRFYGDNNQLIVLDNDTKLNGKVYCDKLTDLNGTFYPFGSLFGQYLKDIFLDFLIPHGIMGEIHHSKGY